MFWFHDIHFLFDLFDWGCTKKLLFWNPGTQVLSREDTLEMGKEWGHLCIESGSITFTYFFNIHLKLNTHDQKQHDKQKRKWCYLKGDTSPLHFCNHKQSSVGSLSS